jgi:hypothetical protein
VELALVASAVIQCTSKRGQTHLIVADATTIPMSGGVTLPSGERFFAVWHKLTALPRRSYFTNASRLRQCSRSRYAG